MVAAMKQRHGLSPEQEEFVRRRWQAQTLFMKGRVILNRRSFYLLRWPAVLGAVVAPSLVGLTLGGASQAIRWATFGITLVVAITTAWESVFRYGRRWRLYRQALDAMRAEGWAFAAGLDQYKGRDKGDESFRIFGEAVQRILRQSGEEYVHGVFEVDEGSERRIEALLAARR